MQGCDQGKLQTERLFLRELDAGDLDFVASMLEDPGVTRFYPKRYTRADAVGWIERQQARYAKDGYGLWLVLLRVELIPVGGTQQPRGLVQVARVGAPHSRVLDAGQEALRRPALAGQVHLVAAPGARPRTHSSQVVPAAAHVALHFRRSNLHSGPPLW